LWRWQARKAATDARCADALERFEHEQPNALWQMDFKGDFQTHQGGATP